MSNIKGIKKVGSPFTNALEQVKVTYDFSVDAGATGILNILECEQDCVITNFYAVVKTACTSGGSMTLDVGTTDNGDLLLDGVAVASLTLGSLHQPFIIEGTPNVLPCPFVLNSTKYLTMEIKTAALTAGKIDFYVTVQRY